MYNYKIGSDVTSQVQSLQQETKKKSKVDELLDSINQTKGTFDTQSDVEVQDNISLERKTASDKTAEEIEQEAKSSLSAYKNDSIKAIEDENKNAQDELLANQAQLQESSQAQKAELEDYYETAKQNASDEALSRGLARSSIVINQLGAFDQDQIDKYNQIDTQLSESIDAINFELNGLESQLATALNDFDITYAVELQDKINELTTELEQEQQAVIEYNNQIALEEADFNKELSELKAELEDASFEKGTDILDVYGKYGSKIVDKYVQDTVYENTKTYLSNLSAEEALQVLQDETIKAALGDLYEDLLAEFNG